MTERERLIKLLKKGEAKYSERLLAETRKLLYEKRRYNSATDKVGNLWDEVADYLLANGVIVPPCKVGDYVWVVYTPKWPANPADKGKWFMRRDGVQRIIFGAKGLSIETWNMGTIPEKEIGKKLFLTEEEAEAALERSRG